MNRPGTSACALAMAAGLTACVMAGPGAGTAGAGAATSKPVAPAETAALLETLVALERRSWNAWQSHDGAFFARFWLTTISTWAFPGRSTSRPWSPAC